MPWDVKVVPAQLQIKCYKQLLVIVLLLIFAILLVARFWVMQQEIFIPSRAPAFIECGVWDRLAAVQCMEEEDSKEQCCITLPVAVSGHTLS